MASLAKKTKTIRARKVKNAGKARKAALNTKGSTPKFPVHKDGASS